MHFVGYHGTSEPSAESLLSEGVRRDKLPPTGQIGPGFYVAREDTWLPGWAATQATARARREMPAWVQLVCRLTGYYGWPLVPEAGRKVVLKVYAREPLKGDNWSIMNEPNLQVLAALKRQGDGDYDPAEYTKMLQLCVPPEELHLLYLKRDDGIPEQSGVWQPKTYDDATAPARTPARRNSR